MKQKNKKGGMLLWVILILIILAIIGAITIYFLITGDGGEIFGGSSVPQPPALPD